MTHTLQFVDKVASSPTVRLDLNTAPWSFLLEGHDFSPPPMRQSVAQTLLAHGAAVPASAFDLRTLRFRVMLQADSADAAATEIQKLARELARADRAVDGANNLIKWQPATTAPVFFCTYPVSMERIQELPPRDGNKVFALSIPAAPFALGLKETSVVSVNHNPAAGSNGQFFDLSSVKGDVDTPLILTVTASGLSHTTNKPLTYLATRRRGTPGSAPFLLQAESFTTLGADTTTQANSATFSGAGNNYTRTTFATTTAMASRLKIDPWPAAAGVDLRGQYRVFVRYRLNSAATGDILMRLTWGYGGSASIINPTVTPPAITGPSLIDLGLVQFPLGADPITEYGNALVVGGQLFQVEAQRTTGSGTLDIDYVLFVAADDQTMILDWNQAINTEPEAFVVDGTTETVYGTDSGNLTGLTRPVGVRGGWIHARPGVTNRIYFLRHVENVAGGDAVTDTTGIVVSYYPQYLYVRPATT